MPNQHTIRRRHMTKEGRPKVPYETMDLAMADVVRLLLELGRYGLQPYLCPVCEKVHIGRKSKRNMKTELKRSFELELGERATYHLLRENYGGEERLRAVTERWQTVVKRLGQAPTSTSPEERAARASVTTTP